MNHRLNQHNMPTLSTNNLRQGIIRSLARYAVLVLVVFTISMGCNDDSDVVGSSPNAPNTPAELTASLEQILDATEVPGFAVSVVHNDAVVYQEAFGYADLDQRIAYTNTTVQHIASISKTFVGAAVVKAIEQGYFSLDTDINDLLPVTLVNPKRPDATIQVRHLVTHTSGLLDKPETYLSENYYILPGENVGTRGAEMLQDGLGIEQRGARPLEDFLAEYYLDDGDLYSLENFAATAPGTSWAYSNVATGLMGYLIEQATGQPFATYVKAEILAPLGMHASTYDVAEVSAANLAVGYFDKDTPFPRYGNDSYPEGSIFTTNADLGRYLLDMAQGIRGQSTTLFSADSYALLFGDLLPTGLVPDGFADNHGVFWYRDGDTFAHGGNSFGVSTHLQLATSGASGYFLLTNMDATFDQAAWGDVASRIDAAIARFVEAQ